jgi:hypothetical protein
MENRMRRLGLIIIFAMLATASGHAAASATVERNPSREKKNCNHIEAAFPKAAPSACRPSRNPFLSNGVYYPSRREGARPAFHRCELRGRLRDAVLFLT